MDKVFFSWLASQPYSVEVAVGAVFVVLIAPAVLGGMVVVAAWVERLVGRLLRMSGLLIPLERETKALWRLRAPRPANPRRADLSHSQRPDTRAAG
jgi:hypothetical protein